MIKEFKKPKSESQCITELKDIKQLPIESVWDFDQKFKALIDQVSFEFVLEQHKEWFIAALLPHIRVPRMQQKLHTLLRREIPMAMGTTTDSQTPEINISQYAIEIKFLTLKDRTSYLIPDG